MRNLFDSRFVQTYSLAREEFLGLLRRRADVALDVMAALARRFRKTDELLRRRMPNPDHARQNMPMPEGVKGDFMARVPGANDPVLRLKDSDEEGVWAR